MSASTTQSPAPGLPGFAWRGLFAVGFGAGVAVFLTLLPGQRLAPSLVYSVCIALACWLCIDGGRLLVARWVHRSSGKSRQWPGWRWMALVLPLGTITGYALGDGIAAALVGRSGPPLAETAPLSFAAVLLLALLPGVAATHFFSTRAHLAASRAQAERAERIAAEQRLKLLASQLEPHMLFNTLANLRVLIGVDPTRAQAMLDRLIPFLRATLAASRADTHALADEFARIDDYLELMRIRMGGRLQTQLDLPAELAERPVPALLLQPLVENAIKHGLEPHVAGGRIEITAAREGNTLLLRVRDTGAGLGAAAPGGGFGLSQVRERLAALHGDAASLSLEAANDADGGTLATLRLPLP